MSGYNNTSYPWITLTTSEGGTGDDRRIDPHLNFGNFIENNNNRLKIFSDPHLDKIRSALTEHLSYVFFQTEYKYSCFIKSNRLLNVFSHFSHWILLQGFHGIVPSLVWNSKSKTLAFFTISHSQSKIDSRFCFQLLFRETVRLRTLLGIGEEGGVGVKILIVSGVEDL